MSLRIDSAHVKRYRQIGMLLLRHGRGDLVRSTGIDAVLDETGNYIGIADYQDQFKALWGVK